MDEFLVLAHSKLKSGDWTSRVNYILGQIKIFTLCDKINKVEVIAIASNHLRARVQVHCDSRHNIDVDVYVVDVKLTDDTHDIVKSFTLDKEPSLKWDQVMIVDGINRQPRITMLT